MTKLNLSPLAEAPRLLRAPVARGVKGGIDRTGGDYGAGIIRNAAIITRGEALGQGFWIDKTMVRQVVDAANASNTGTKSRFTHPDLSGDGLGKALGRFRDVAVLSDVARGDLHIYESAHKTPDGDLAGYTMDLAVEDPEAFGVSIAYEPDPDGEAQFVTEHKDKDGFFRSPDKDNKANYLHTRLAELTAADMVDDPAANPSGLFHRGDEISFAADALVAYALGLSDDCPEMAFGVHPDRLRGFVQRFLSGRGLGVLLQSEVKARDKDKQYIRQLVRGIVENEQASKSS